MGIHSHPFKKNIMVFDRSPLLEAINPATTTIKKKNMGLNYVNITTPGGEGWLNLFAGEHIIALVNNVYLADKIRAEVLERIKRIEKIEPMDKQVGGSTE